MENKILEIIAERFRVLGDPLRLQILHLLKQDERSVGALVEATSASQANVSQHLQILRQAGLVERRKEGLMAFYRIADSSIFQLCELVCGRLEEQYRDDLDAIARLHAADGREAGKDAPRG